METNVAEFNMGVASMVRIDALFRMRTQLRIMQYDGGIPTLPKVYSIDKEIYAELDPYLTDKEVEVFQKDYLQVLEDSPIMTKGNRMLIPQRFETTLDKFNIAMRRMFFNKGVMTKLGENDWDDESD